VSLEGSQTFQFGKLRSMYSPTRYSPAWIVNNGFILASPSSKGLLPVPVHGGNGMRAGKSCPSHFRRTTILPPWFVPAGQPEISQTRSVWFAPQTKSVLKGRWNPSSLQDEHKLRMCPQPLRSWLISTASLRDFATFDAGKNAILDAFGLNRHNSLISMHLSSLETSPASPDVPLASSGAHLFPSGAPLTMSGVLSASSEVSPVMSEVHPAWPEVSPALSGASLAASGVHLSP
jgi:hypothetical protein